MEDAPQSRIGAWHAIVGRTADRLRRRIRQSHRHRRDEDPIRTCAWARDELPKKAQESLAGPLASAGLDIMEALRADPEGRREMGLLLQYLLDSASKHNALGIKGAGEAGTIGATPAVMNAVTDALHRACGIGHIEMPATPQRVWQALAEARPS